MLEKSVGQEPAERKLSTGKLDPFYHFNTHPDTGAKTCIAIAASRDCIPEP